VLYCHPDSQLIGPPQTQKAVTLPENRKLKTVMKSKISLLLTSALIYIASTVCAEETYTYGPIKSGDMLWTIAGKVSPSTVSRHQAIIALHRINAHAFRVSCNVNSLKVGETLRIPSLSEMLALNKASATKEFDRQNKQWRNRYKTTIACPPVAINPVIPKTPSVAETTEEAKSTETPIKPTETVPTEMVPTETVPTETSTVSPTVLTTAANDILKPDTATKPDTVTNNTYKVEENATKTANDNKPNSSHTSQPSYPLILIVMMAIGGLLAAFFIGWLLHKQAKIKAKQNNALDDYEPYNEMPLPIREEKSP